MIVGYSAFVDPTKQYKICNNGAAVYGEELNKYFGGAKHVVYAISNETEWFKDDQNDKIILKHHAPTWGGFLGAGMYFVDDNGELHLIGIHVGGSKLWNYGITTNHPFLKKLSKAETIIDQSESDE